MNNNENGTLTKNQNANEQWTVAYAKILLDKDRGVTLSGVYLGGIGRTSDEADMIARECVNTIKGGTIIPKIIRIDENTTLIDALYDAHDRFETIIKRMQDAESILSNGKKK